ncbi:MAG: hypothetical protein V4690_00975 [Patescibacteria group bacterium]
MDIQKLILTSEEYKKVRFTTPYILEISNEKQELVYLGVQHSTDIQNPQFETIEKHWRDFIKDKTTSECVVVIESGLLSTNLVKEDAVIKQGESGLTVFLAQESGVEVLCFEPNRIEVMQSLLSKFSKEALFYHHVAQMLLQWNRYVNKPEFNSYIDKVIQNDKTRTGWDDLDFSFDNIQKIHKSIFQNDIDINDKDFFNKIVNPHLDFSVINKISKSYTDIREVKIVEGIHEQWNLGKSIFVVYGCGHAIVQERALRELLK